MSVCARHTAHARHSFTAALDVQTDVVPRHAIRERDRRRCANQMRSTRNDGRVHVGAALVHATAPRLALSVLPVEPSGAMPSTRCRSRPSYAGWTRTLHAYTLAYPAWRGRSMSPISTSIMNRRSNSSKSIWPSPDTSNASITCWNLSPRSRALRPKTADASKTSSLPLRKGARLARTYTVTERMGPRGAQVDR